MNKRKLHHVWRKTQKLSYRYFLVGFVLWATIAVFALRNNNLTALKLRDEVLQVDQQNGDVEASLRALREFIYGHMNTSLASSTSVYPPIQLKYRYERLVEAEKAKAPQSNPTADAQAYCEANFPESFYGAGRLPCIQNYIDTHPIQEAAPPNIPDSLYKFDFASPRWSPDLAGWSIVLAGLFGLTFVISFVLERWMQTQMRSHL
jgi:hypothetical protein